jgi:hypothetical protein
MTATTQTERGEGGVVVGDAFRMIGRAGHGGLVTKARSARATRVNTFAGSDDFLTEVSGTNAVAGAADATLVLKRGRGQADGVLHVTGRDVDETEYALSFNAASGAWSMLDGPADEHQTTETHAAILRYLRGNPGSGPRAIAEGTGLGEPNVEATCRRMLAAGLLAADGKACYTVPDGARWTPRVSHASLTR